MRLIDADALKESIRCSDTDEPKVLSPNKLHKVLTEWIDKRPTIEERKMGRWIPVSERLPEEKTEVLVTSSEYLYIAEYEVLSDGTRYWSEVIEYRHIQDVTAWMPLPEPYKGHDGGGA